MHGPLGYSDAVRLLGGTGPAPDLVLGLFDPKAELAELSRGLVSGLAERIQGLGRFDRTERIAAAHAVIVVAAYGEALARVELPFDHRRLAVTRAESVHLVTGGPPESGRLAAVAEHLLHVGLPVPSPHLPYERTLDELLGHYAATSRLMARYVAGCAVWDTLDDGAREQVDRTLVGQVPEAAVARYEELFRQLAVDFPDVAVWADRVDHRATRAGLLRLEEAVAGLAAGALPSARIAALRAAGAAGLDGPVIGARETTGGLVVPTLREAYVSADFRVAEYGPSDRLVHEYWWEEYERRPGLDGFLAELLASPLAAARPVLLLGQPGSGKSYLTKVLAATLPADDFLVVRVALRSVPADSGVQEQIESAIRQTTGETMDWPDVARAAGGALPVVLLDGFDELLQATGLNQSDYLERVAAFQRREAGLGRPLAVVVTSRTVVADRARLTDAGIAIRLEDFSPAQTRRWLELWNAKNSAHFTAQGLLPLDPDRVLIQPELAGQPLLLLMLALYDAQDNAFQREAGALGGFELYERLLARFARREVLKHAPALPEGELAHAVEQELLRLSVAALGMFNRGRQWVTEDELDADLAVLLPQQFAPVAASGLRAPLGKGQATVGRFFFVQKAEAFRDAELLRSYEFLHATFGEFLVARLVAREVLDLAEAERPGARRSRVAAPDDAFLHALLSFAVLSDRAPVVGFLAEALAEGLTGLPAERRVRLRALLVGLFHDSQRERRTALYADYRPAGRPVPARHALYGVNLLLLILGCGSAATGRELFPDAAPDPVDSWRNLMLLAKSQLLPDEWSGFVGHVALERVWDGDRREVEVRATVPEMMEWALEGERVGAYAVDPYWTYDWGPGSPNRRHTTGYLGWTRRSPVWLERESYLLCDADTDVLLHAVQGLYEAGFGDVVTGFARLGDASAASTAHLLLRLWAQSPGGGGVGAAGAVGAVGGPGLTELHRDAIRAVYAFDPARPEFTKRYLAAVLHQWRLAGQTVDEEWTAQAYASIDEGERGLGELLNQLLAAHGGG